MHNLRLLCDHVHGQIENGAPRVDPDWKMPRVIPHRDEGDFYIDQDGGVWRALSCIQNAHPLESITSLDHAGEVGRALGIFHSLTSNFNHEKLQDTLPGFHNIEKYIKQYDQALLQTIIRETFKAKKFCQQFIEDRRYWAPVLENGRRQNELRERVIHGDPKINNILMDNETDRAVSIIDLDTVKPGLLLYDIGDCLRSCCTVPGEEVENPGSVKFDLDRCAAALSGYMTEARGCVTYKDFEFLYDAIRLIPFELGVRLFTDFLEGNVYFKTSRPKQNIERALVQFKLVESIEKQEAAIRGIVDNCQEHYQKE
jgi:Ser/Thr protein kinase RdoA (MazF antagonist)